jgi:hypothetical protein
MASARLPHNTADASALAFGLRTAMVLGRPPARSEKPPVSLPASGLDRRPFSLPFASSQTAKYAVRYCKQGCRHAMLILSFTH